MIDEEEFWQLLKPLGRDAGDDDFDRLTARLASRPEADIRGFADRLAMVLWTLDTPAHFAAAQTSSDDVFLYVRCAVVTAGREAYDRVFRKPTALERFADGEAELLLTVAEQAYEWATGRLWEHDTPVSYESGSNIAAWGEAERVPVPVGSSTPPTWLGLTFGSGLPEPPDAYGLFLQKVIEAVAADPAWQRWWALAGVPSCELSLLLEGTGDCPPEVTVKKGRRRIQVHVTRDPGPFPADDPAALLVRATDDIRDLLNLARERVGLGSLPPLVAPPLPIGLPAEFFGPRHRPVPAFPAELHERAISGEDIGPQELIDYFRTHPDAEGAAFWQQLDTGGR